MPSVSGSSAPAPHQGGRNARVTRVIAGLLCLAIVVLGYFMFEPLVVWQFGWKALPAETFTTVGESKTWRPDYAQQIASAQAVLAKAQRELEAPAMSVAVGVDGELVWAESRGFADVDARTPAKLDSRFRIGSTSKAVTATAMGKLIETGKLNLDAPIAGFTPVLAGKPVPVTPRQVLSHTAGFRDYGWCFCFPVWEYHSTKQYANVQESLATLKAAELEAQPATRFKYTSPGFNVAGLAAEQASGKPFGEFLNDSLFLPLGMRDSSLDYADRKVPGRVHFYNAKAQTYKSVFAVNNSNKWPAGGIVSTPSDLVRMGNALVTDRYFGAGVREQLFTPQKLQDGTANPQGYALGWRNHQRKFTNGTKVTAINHGGLAVGSTSFLVLFPDQRVVVSILMNLDSEGTLKLHQPAYAIAEIFLAERMAAAKQ